MFIDKFNGIDLTISGWGYTNEDEDDEVRVDFLQMAQVKLAHRDKCNYDQVKPKIMERVFYCAEGEVSDACKGDSGGKLSFTDGN